MKTFTLLEVREQQKKDGSGSFRKLRLRYEELNQDGVPIELWVAGAMAARGVDYRPGQTLAPVIKYARNRYDDIFIQSIDFIPTETAAPPKAQPKKA